MQPLQDQYLLEIRGEIRDSLAPSSIGIPTATTASSDAAQAQQSPEGTARNRNADKISYMVHPQVDGTFNSS